MLLVRFLAPNEVHWLIWGLFPADMVCDLALHMPSKKRIGEDHVLCAGEGPRSLPQGMDDAWIMQATEVQPVKKKEPKRGYDGSPKSQKGNTSFAHTTPQRGTPMGGIRERLSNAHAQPQKQQTRVRKGGLGVATVTARNHFFGTEYV